MGLVVLLVGAVLGAFKIANSVTRDQGDRTNLWSDVQDASGQLLRDVSDGNRIEKAEAQQLVLYVVRDEMCQRRTFTADPGAKKFTVQTDYFAQKTCSGPTESRTQTLVSSYSGTETFRYETGAGTTIPVPVQNTRGIKKVSWNLVATPVNGAAAVELSSGAAFRGKSDDSGSGEQAMEGLAPLLTVVTGADSSKREGLSRPALSWQDSTPALTQSYTVRRASGPEGAAERVRWTDVASIPAGTTTWVDDTTTFGWGDTGIYVVVANLRDGTQGPTSNQVVTGLRPSIPTGLTATGKPQQIDLAWTNPSGSTGTDVYRDGKLIARVGAGVRTFVDQSGVGHGAYAWTGTGYGHSHNYTVVATNRWESLGRNGSQNTQVPLSDDISKEYSPNVANDKKRVHATATGAFTAPNTPTLAVSAATNWSFGLTVTPAAWVGSGPTTKDGVGARDAWWTKERNGSNTATPNGTWTLFGSNINLPTRTHSDPFTQAAVASQYRHYRVNVCSTIGCSPTSAGVGALQRPATPASCSVGTADIGTRNVNVTINPAPGAVIGNTGYWLSGGTGDPTSQGDHAGNVIRVDQLRHSTAHTFTVRTKNASAANGGYSDNQTCSGATAPLGASTPTWSSTTRAVSGSFTPTNGTSHTISLDGSARNGTSATWDPLTHNRGYSLVATVSDGYNSVSASTTATTKLLASPGAPSSCTVSVSTSVAPGALTINGGDRVRLGSSGTVYTSPRAYSGLSAGSYTGQAQNTNSDGHNVTYSGWATCGTATITAPPPPPTWSGSIPEACNARIGDILYVWSQNWAATHIPPTSSDFEFQTTRWDADGKPTAMAWRVWTINRTSGWSEMQTGISTCSGQIIGV